MLNISALRFRGTCAIHITAPYLFHSCFSFFILKCFIKHKIRKLSNSKTSLIGDGHFKSIVPFRSSTLMFVPILCTVAVVKE